MRNASRLNSALVIERLEPRALMSAAATSTVLAESISSGVFGQGVTLTATVSTKTGKPAGTVTFKDGSSSVGSASLNSSEKAVVTLAILPVGTDSLTAVYGGSSAFASSTSPGVKETISKASTTTALSVSSSTSAFGQSITLTSTVTAKSPGSGVPSGTVTFKSGTMTLGTETLSSKGVATLSSGALAVGSASIVATYNGATNYATGASAGVSHTVAAASTTTALVVSSTSSVFGQAVTLTSTVMVKSPGVGVPTGTITFKSGSVTLGTATLSAKGIATLSVGNLAVGSAAIVATYKASADFGSSVSAGILHSVAAASTTASLTVSAASSVFGQAITLTSTVAVKSPGLGAPTGAVTFKSGTVTLGTATLNSKGIATLSVGNIAVGTASIVATYSGVADYTASTSAGVSHSVAAASTTASLTASSSTSTLGQAISLTCTVVAKSPGGGVPTGSVTFKSGTVTLGTATLSSAGIATLSTGALAIGTASIVATYNGVADYASSVSPGVSHTVSSAITATATTLVVSTSSALLGQSVTVTVTVADVAPGTGTPSGTVSLYDGKTLLSTQALTSTGKFSQTLPVLFEGVHALSVVYSGGTQFKTSTSAVSNLEIKLPAMTTASNGLQTGTSVAGTGAGAADGQSLHVNYTGFLLNGTVFDTSLQSGRTPFDFTLGAGSVIAGWDQGMVGMKVGEERVLIVPPALGYGSTAQGSIPANSTLIFLVNLLSFNVPRLSVTTTTGTSISDGETPATADGTIFSAVAVGKTGTAESFVLSNVGAGSLEFTSSTPVELTGANAGDFVLTQPAVSNNQAIFTVTFKPTAKGLRQALITILTNDPQHPSFSFTIEGTGD